MMARVESLILDLNFLNDMEMRKRLLKKGRRIFKIAC